MIKFSILKKLIFPDLDFRNKNNNNNENFPDKIYVFRRCD